MAKIENLIGEIADARLREEIAREVTALKRQTKFGLVFEEHIPEQVQLPGLPVKAGMRVAKRGESSKDVFLVEEVHGNGRARIRQENSTEEGETAATKDLVAVKRFGEPIYPTLTPAARLTRAEGKPYHTIINADNFHVLQLLLYCYSGQVDVIYIDPPYNTGARDWKYNNDYVDSTDQWRHSKWLSMMQKRLLLAKRLLSPTGVIVVAIDDNEVHHLRCLMEKIFTSDLHMGTICVRHKPGGTTTARKIARSHEYALFYAATENVSPCLLERTDEQMARFKHRDDEGVYEWENFRKHGQGCRRGDRPRQFYPIWIYPDGQMRVPAMDYDEASKEWRVHERRPSNVAEVWPLKGKEPRVWLWAPENFSEHPSMFRVEAKKGEHIIYKKRRPNRQGIVPNTSWTDTRYSANEHGSGMIVKVFGSTEPFDFAKSVYTIADCLAVACGKKDALILDFFAGSGTTYQATALLNADDGGNRRSILVTNNEVNEKVAKHLNEAGLLPGDPEFEKHGICEAVTWPRCKYVTQGHRDDGTPLPGQYLDGGKLKDGLKENLEYFRLDFLDPHEVAYGDRFEAILPILWLMAGAKGERETVRGRGKWFIPKSSPYAVLLKEEHFADFKRELADRPHIALVFLVTDSEEAFREMSADLPGRPQTKMLYKSYLDNFRINLEKDL